MAWCDVQEFLCNKNNGGKPLILFCRFNKDDHDVIACRWWLTRVNRCFQSSIPVTCVRCDIEVILTVGYGFRCHLVICGDKGLVTRVHLYRSRTLLCFRKFVGLLVFPNTVIGVRGQFHVLKHFQGLLVFANAIMGVHRHFCALDFLRFTSVHEHRFRAQTLFA